MARSRTVIIAKSNKVSGILLGLKSLSTIERKVNPDGFELRAVVFESVEFKLVSPKIVSNKTFATILCLSSRDSGHISGAENIAIEKIKWMIVAYFNILLDRFVIRFEYTGGFRQTLRKKNLSTQKVTNIANDARMFITGIPPLYVKQKKIITSICA